MKVDSFKLIDSADGKSQATQRVEVKVGLRSPGKVEILEGLAPGDTVVTTGQQRIQRDGTLVTVVDLAGSRSARPASDPQADGAAPAVAPALAATATNTAPAPQAGRAPAKAAPAPALAGPNPCGLLVSEAPSALVPVNDGASPARPQAPPAPRDPG